MASTKATLIANVNANYADNTTGDITPLDARTTETEEINSWQQAPLVNSQVGVSGYTVVTADYGKLIIFNNATAVSVALPGAGTPSFFPFNVMVKNEGVGTVTITPTVGLVDGALSLNLLTGQSVWLLSDATNWRSVSGSGGGGGTPGGSATEIQYRAGPTTFGGAAGSSWDQANRALRIDGTQANKFVLASNPALDGKGIAMACVLSLPTSASEPYFVNRFGLTETVDSTVTGLFANVNIDHSFGGPGTKGNRASLIVSMGMTAPTEISGVNRDYTTTSIFARAASHDNGTALVSRGGFWAQNLVTEALSGATFLSAIVGTEINVLAHTGSSVVSKNGIRIAQAASDDTVQGSSEDCAIIIVASTGSIGWRDAILFNVPSSDFTGPVNATNGTLFRAKADVPWTVLNGIDISGPTITGSAFKSNGFLVDGSGMVNSAVGYRYNNTAPIGQVLRGNGTNFVAATLTTTDVGGREVLAANRIYYVRSDGSDANNGLTNTSGGAFLTLQGAYNSISTKVDFGGKAVTIQVVAVGGPSTYTGGLQLTQAWTGGGTLTILGDATTPSNVTINATNNIAFYLTAGIPGTLIIQGFKIGGGTTTYALQSIAGGALVLMRNIEFAAVSSVHISVQAPGAIVNMNTNYTISGGAILHMQAFLGGAIYAAGITATVSGTPAFSGQFAQSSTLGVIYAPSTIFSGAATGARYLVDGNSVINTGGGGANFFPGNAAGSVSSGGQYL